MRDCGVYRHYRDSRIPQKIHRISVPELSGEGSSMNLDKRLSAAAELVPHGARLADIGSDHAYLPISLCLDGKIEYALASDINEGPVASAIANIHANGLDGKISAVRADGLAASRDFAPDCISVLGMGGELIVSILDAADWIRDERITLVLQPMTHPEILSKYLAENGFYIKDEIIVKDKDRTDRIYRIICAGFDGKLREISEAEAYVGRINLERGDADTVEYVKKILRTLRVRIDGKRASGNDCSYEEELCTSLAEFVRESV